MILFTKYSNERDSAFAIRTDIIEENGKKSVRKYPLTEDASAHVRNMENACRLLAARCSGTRFSPNKCRPLDDGGMAFEYLEGETLEERIDRLLTVGSDAAWSLMKEYLDEIDRTADASFAESDGFRKVFGHAVGLDGLRACRGADIDLLPSNIIVSGDTWNITDYEWTFDFLIPVNFIKWRILFYYERSAARLLKNDGSSYAAAGIDEKQRKIYKEMELSFQRYIEGTRVPVRNLYEAVSDGAVLFPDADARLKKERVGRVAEFFVDRGTGFSQEASRALEPDKNGDFVLDVVMDGVKAVRIDPASAPCIVRIKRLVTEKGYDLLRFVSGNGTFILPDGLVFDGNDPQIVLREWPEKTEKIHIEFERAMLDEAEEQESIPAWMEEAFSRSSFAGRQKSYAEIWRGDQCENVLVNQWSYGNEEGEIHIDEDVTRVDIIPAQSPCMVTFSDISTDQGVFDIAEMRSNGLYLEENIFFFDSDAPRLTVTGWPEGSRILNFSFSKQMLDRGAAKAMGRRFAYFRKCLDEERARNRDKARILTDRDNELRKLMAMRSVRIIRKARREAGRGDMFEPFRTIPENCEQYIVAIDEKWYGTNAFHVKGWCADRDFSRIDIRILDADGRLLNARIPRTRRPDVAKNLKLDPEGMYGFRIAVPYKEITKPPVYVEFSTPRGTSKRDLEYEPDPAKRKDDKKAGVEESYDTWYRRRRPSEEELDDEREHGFDQNILFSIVVPLYKTPEKFLNELIESVENQTYPGWELVLSDGSGEDSPLTGLLDEWSAKDSRIRVLHNNRQLRISENTNAAIEAAGGDYVVFCDHDDLLAPDALYENMRLIASHPEAEAIYSDEDKIDTAGKYTEPNFKPDFDRDLLDATNYICHLLVVKRSLLGRTGGLNPEFDGAQDHDLVLRISEVADFFHIPKILYHWRLSEASTAGDPATKPYAFEAGCRAVKAHYDRKGIPASVKRTKYPGIYRTYYHWESRPKVSIIIPNYEHPDLLRRCVDSIVSRCAYPDYEIVVVENNSRKKETFDLYAEYEKTLPNFKLVKFDGPFNFSAINNLGVSRAEGEYLLFLNNDTEFMGDSVLEELLYPCMREDVGAVGARLYYEDGTIQHAGVIVGVLGVAANAFAGFQHASPGYMGRIICQADLSAVTAACVMVKRSVFEKIGGFYEGLAVAFNDIDICMKIRRAGFLVEYNPYAELSHYESKSRGEEDTPEKQRRFEREIALFKKRWPEILEKGDPYYNPNLTLKRSDFSLREDDEIRQGGM